MDQNLTPLEAPMFGAKVNIDFIQANTPAASSAVWQDKHWVRNIWSHARKEESNEISGINGGIILGARKELAPSSAPFSHTKLSRCIVAVYCFPPRYYVLAAIRERISAHWFGVEISILVSGSANISLNKNVLGSEKLLPQ